jgi:hypothetical protein
MLGAVTGPDAASWDDALTWARELADVIYTRYPDGHLHKLTNPPPDDTALQEFAQLGRYVWPNHARLIQTAPDRLVIRDLPNEASKTRLSQQLVELIRAGTLTGVNDLRDTTGADRILRLDLVLKPVADPQPARDTIERLLRDL